MQRLFYCSFFLVLWSCGGENKPNQSEDNVLYTDTTEIEDTELSQEDTVSIQEVGFNVLDDYYALIDSKTALYENFSEENIMNDTAWYAEGTVMMLSSILDDPDNGHQIRFMWSEEDNESLSMIEAHHELYNENWELESTQEVSTNMGIHTGMTLQELVEWNGGREIEFAGFAWDYAGAVFVKEDSRLMEAPFSITLSIDYEAASDRSDLMGDMTLNSADENVKDAPIFVGVITYYESTELADEF